MMMNNPQTPRFSLIIPSRGDRPNALALALDHIDTAAGKAGLLPDGLEVLVGFDGLRGERVRVYPDVILRNKVKERFSTALEWDPIGLPENYLPLLAPSRQAFVQETQHIVCHGGISVEELIVPLVQIERRSE